MGWLGPAIGLGSALVGGIFGAKAAKLSPEEKALMAQRTANMQKMGGMADTMSGWAAEDRPVAQGYMKQGMGMTSSPASYWAQTLQRDPYNRSNYMVETAGARGEEGAAYNKATSAMLALSPRSGAAASTMMEMPFRRGAQESSNYANWITAQKQRQGQAASELGGMGLGIMTQGQSLIGKNLQAMSGAMQGLGGVERSAADMMEPYAKQREGSAGAWGAAGRAAAPWIEKIVKGIPKKYGGEK